MTGKYVGYVSGDDPLHGFLSKITRDGLGVRNPHPAFRAFRLTGSNVVYSYEEKSSRTRMICKFYGPRFSADRGRAASLAHREYESLNTLRGYQLVGSPHHVIRPLGVDPDINGVLAVEYYAGEQFSQAIGTSIRSRNDAHLFWRLKALAYYLATQHNRTANGERVDFEIDCRYFETVVDRLHRRRRIGQWDAEELCWLRDLWRGRPRMWGGPAGLAARRRHPGELPVRPRHGRRRDRPGTHEAGRPHVRRRAHRRGAATLLHGRNR